MSGTYVNYIVIIKYVYKICYNKMRQEQSVIKTVRDAIISVEMMKMIDERQSVIQGVL